MFEDNTGAIAIAKNPVHHSRMKHIDIKHLFIRDRIKSKEIKVYKIGTKYQIADIFTKALRRMIFLFLLEFLYNLDKLQLDVITEWTAEYSYFAEDQEI